MHGLAFFSAGSSGIIRSSANRRVGQVTPLTRRLLQIIYSALFYHIGIATEEKINLTTRISETSKKHITDNTSQITSRSEYVEIFLSKLY